PVASTKFSSFIHESSMETDFQSVVRYKVLLRLPCALRGLRSDRSRFCFAFYFGWCSTIACSGRTFTAPKNIAEIGASHQRILNDTDDIGNDKVDGDTDREGQRKEAVHQRHDRTHRLRHRLRLIGFSIIAWRCGRHSHFE